MAPIFGQRAPTPNDDDDLMLLQNGHPARAQPLISSVAETNFQRTLDSFQQMSLFSASNGKLVFRPNVRVELSRQPSPLGRFVVLSKQGANRVRINAIPKGGDQVTKEVFSRVLNDADLVDFSVPVSRSNGGGEDALYFTKSLIWQSSKDIQELRRLGASRVNLTMHESLTSKNDANSKILDVKLHLPQTVINIRYGSAPELEKSPPP